MKTRVEKTGGRLESWFSREDVKIEKFLHEMSMKAINNLKIISSGG